MTLQRRPANHPKPATVPPIVHDVLRSPGQPLDPATRAYMEPRFGHDFSRVRVHADDKAAESARAVNALAYTVGRDVVFGLGQYAPTSTAGRHLLAHELSHVVQQSHLSEQPPKVISSPTHQFEREANEASGRMVRGTGVERLSAAPSPMLSRNGGPIMTGIHDPSATSPKTSSCKVNSFGMKIKPWKISWPGYFSGTTTIQLPVDFRVDLAAGSTKQDCVIGQDMQGRNESCKPEEWPGWTSDSGVGWRDWWDGNKWNAGRGSWDWFGEGADFHDAPGFRGIEKRCYPLYRGGVGRKGHFKYRTYIKDKKTRKTVRTLHWGLLIDYSAPKTGRHYFYL